MSHSQRAFARADAAIFRAIIVTEGHILCGRCRYVSVRSAHARDARHCGETVQ